MIRLIIWCKPFARYFLAVWIITIIAVSSVPSIPTLKIHTAKVDIRLDYMMHFCEYGFLAFLSFLSFAGDMFRIRLGKFILITLCLIAFAVLDEFHQKLIPGRSFNVKDILSNILGITVALLFFALVFKKVVKKIGEAG
jgi:VanZ family protein